MAYWMHLLGMPVDENTRRELLETAMADLVVVVRDYSIGRKRKENVVEAYNPHPYPYPDDWRCRQMMTIMSCVDYQGFDPLEIVQSLRIQHRPQEEYSFMNDMKLMCMLILQRSTYMKKTFITWSYWLCTLINKYHIYLEPASGRRQALRADAVSLAKVAACFPMLMIEAAKKTGGRSLISGVRVHWPTAPNEWLVPSIIPLLANEVVTAAKDIHVYLFLIMVKMDITIRKGRPAPLAAIFNYYKAAYNSNVVSNQVRLIAMRKYGLIDADDNLPADLVNALPLCVRDIRAKKGGSAILAELRALPEVP